MLIYKYSIIGNKSLNMQVGIDKSGSKLEQDAIGTQLSNNKKIIMKNAGLWSKEEHAKLIEGIIDIQIFLSSQKARSKLV